MKKKYGLAYEINSIDSDFLGLQESLKPVSPAEEEINNLFNDLLQYAYNVDSHNYCYKKANQIIRKHFEEFASQLKQSDVTDEDIEKWVDDNYISILSKEKAAEGAKAMRDGKIK
jgi:hypothetical protein